MKRILCILLILTALPLSAQVDRKEVRAGNRKFRKADYKNAEIDYRRAVVKDSLSFAGEYNLASSLYRQEDYQGAAKALETIKETAPAHDRADDYYFNLGDTAIKVIFLARRMEIDDAAHFIQNDGIIGGRLALR